MDLEDNAQNGPPAAAKVDPETLTLRARPAKAIRFKRGAIVGLVATASVALAATAWVALKPTTFHIVSQTDDQPTATKVPGDALSALPTSYGDAPKLGAPLPGDLGRPILDRQRVMATEAGPPRVAPQSTINSEREQAAAQAKAARESGLLATSAGRTTVAGEPAGPPAANPIATNDPARTSLDPERDPNSQLRKTDFASGVDKNGPVDSHVLTPLRSPYTLSAGSVISASLITGLRSDLPGLVTAQVTERVFDSATGQIELIPQGARLIGTYDSVVAFGQSRALVVWQRIILPNGSSLQIDNVPATDPAGYAGLADKVDFHTWALLKGVALSTLLGVGSSLTFTGESDLVQAIRESTQQNVSRAGDQLTSKNLQVQPTITIRPGASVRLVVHRDLILAPWHS
ncbi:TrbI/VirB10 family protein [Sphingomonas sp. UYEF23]|uniref:TrbI/VirB10 family protein n=1 Tax=Sphingomonas sp. UYEF23 TaxID=1756408 RepID=UPI0033924D33